MVKRRTLNILMISSGFYPKVDGTTLAISNLIQGLKKRGHKIILLTRRYKGCAQSEYWKGTPVFRAGPPNPSVFSRLKMAINQIAIGAPIIVREKINVIHVHGFAPLLSGLVLGLAFRRPVVVTFHGFQSLWDRGTQWQKESTNRIAKPFLKTMARNSTAVIAQSEKFKEVLIQTYDVRADRVHVISHFIDEESFKQCPQLSSREPIVLFVGTLAKVYGVDLFIRSAPYTTKHVPNARFLIVGKGPFRPKLETLLRILKVENSIRFVGPVFDREKLAKIYCSAKVVVIPQKYGGYFLSLVALEAMALGKPVVTTQILDPELYQHGFFKASFDPEDIAEKITMILTMENEEYARLSETVRRHFEANYSKNSVVSKIEELYFHLTNDAKAT